MIQKKRCWRYILRQQEAKDKLIDKVKIKYVDSAELEDTDAETNADTTEDATEDTSGEE